jgi:hypothetical protein
MGNASGSYTIPVRKTKPPKMAIHQGDRIPMYGCEATEHPIWQFLSGTGRGVRSQSAHIQTIYAPRQARYLYSYSEIYANGGTAFLESLITRGRARDRVIRRNMNA